MPAKKSFISKIEETILRFTKQDYMDSKEKVDYFLKNKSDDKPSEGIFKSFDFKGMEVFTFGDENAKSTILYIHGGAYVNQINYQHFLFCFLLSRKLDAYVLAPVYPLAPESSAKQSYDLITELYKRIIQRNNLILMGDSAGGGFVHSFCQYLKTVDLPQPNKIVTFSPWVDVSMSNPPYDSENDPILGEIGLKEIGKSWAGEWDTRDYRVSPLVGDNENLPDTLIFAGEDEIFYSDITKYVESLEGDGVNVRLVTGKGLFHIYPLFPMPETLITLKEIKKEIID